MKKDETKKEKSWRVFVRMLLRCRRKIEQRPWMAWTGTIGWILFASLVLTFSIFYIQYNDRLTAWGWVTEHVPNFVLSYLLITLVFSALSCLGQLWVPTLTVSVVTLVSASIQFYKMNIRGEPFLPWDLGLSKELVNIFPQLEIQLSKPIITALLIDVVLVAISVFLPTPRIQGAKKRWGIRVASLLVLAGFSVFYVRSTFMDAGFMRRYDIYDNQWEPAVGYQDNGFLPAFLMNYKYLRKEPPTDYSKKKMGDLTQQLWESLPSPEGEAQTPDLIVIMSESFWDVTMLPSVTFEEDPLPTLHYLQENYLSGTTFSPVFGGMTSNVEFESITGFSNSFLPVGSVPYQQYVLRSFPSAASFLRDQGYQTVAIHPYIGSFWNRDEAYPNLGFQQFHSLDDFTDAEYKRTYVSDLDVSKKIIESYKSSKRQSDAPFFNFTVTVQNHFSYYASNFAEEEWTKFSTKGLSNEVVEGLKDFATGLRYSDQALRYLLDYFEGVDTPVVVAFFGDHMSVLGEYTQVFEESGLLSKESTDLEKAELLYQTPFVVWSNFSKEKVDVGRVADNMLLPIIMDQYQMDMPVYFAYLNHIRPVTGGFNRGYVVQPDSSLLEEGTEQQQEIRHQLELIQYDVIFGKGYAQGELFQSYYELKQSS